MYLLASYRYYELVKLDIVIIFVFIEKWFAMRVEKASVVKREATEKLQKLISDLNGE